jgi:hypothetical protein
MFIKRKMVSLPATIIVVLANSGVQAQQAGWRPTTDLDRKFEEDAIACRPDLAPGFVSNELIRMDPKEWPAFRACMKKRGWRKDL